MIDYIKKNVLDIREDQMDVDAIHASMIGNVRLKEVPLIILFCAIVIASVGLNINSTAVIIGAIIITIPALLSSLYLGFTSYQTNQIYSNVEAFVDEQVNSSLTTTMRATVFQEEKNCDWT